MSDKRTFEQLMNDLQKELVSLTWELKAEKEDEEFVIGRVVLAITAIKQLHAKRTKS